MNFITIELIKVEQQIYIEQDIITWPMNKILNISFNKHPMSQEFIHCHILHPSDSVMK